MHGPRPGRSATTADAGAGAVPKLDGLLDLFTAADIAGRLAVLKPAGRDRLVGRRPVHVERTPSFEVRGVGKPGRLQRVRCHGCGLRGDAVDPIAAHEGRTREEVLADLPHRPGVASAASIPRRKPAPGFDTDLADDFRSRALRLASGPACNRAPLALIL